MAATLRPNGRPCAVLAKTKWSVAARLVPHYRPSRGKLVYRSHTGRAYRRLLGLCSGTGVGVAIDIEKSRRVHRRINLG